MKAILISIKPQHVANILNGLKTLEIRKKFPKDYVGWVYIYCTKKDSLGRIKDLPHDRYFVDCVETPQDFEKMDSGYDGKGKVVARFWCDKVVEFYDFDDDLCEQACLDRGEMLDYLGNKKGYAIHITKVEPFAEPKEISEFKNICPNVLCDKCKYGSKEIDLALPICKRQLTRAPESWCYIEV